MGTWIETVKVGTYDEVTIKSFPSWERGLKLRKMPSIRPITNVVPLVGTWIETYFALPIFPLPIVVPLVGTWIETCVYAFVDQVSESFPSWERGLKLAFIIPHAFRKKSFPSWERGLKQYSLSLNFLPILSFPSWERGLKPAIMSVSCPVNGRRSPRGNVD